MSKHRGKGIGRIKTVDFDWEQELKKKIGQIFQILLKTYKLGREVGYEVCKEEGKKDKEVEK
nr:MAG: hypothetical protein [uncultured archaeon]